MLWIINLLQHCWVDSNFMARAFTWSGLCTAGRVLKTKRSMTLHFSHSWGAYEYTVLRRGQMSSKGNYWRSLFCLGCKGDAVCFCFSLRSKELLRPPEDNSLIHLFPEWAVLRFERAIVMRFGSSFLNRGHLSTLLPQNAMAIHGIFQRIGPRWLTSDTIFSPLLLYKLYLIQHFFFLSFRNFLIRKMRLERLHNRSIDPVMAI